MSENLVNLNVNPCKMCMPMGAVSALYGIKKCISILHGSQGCSTYIRRHMATHYNEPVDIASSSLTEEGTVYGGEDNLIKGLINLINLYQPQVIGVPTTCLAETIGEDIKRIIHNFYEKYPEHKDIVIIPVPSAGYAGTQYEGFFQAINQIIRTVEMDPSHSRRINVITGMLSPADTRYLKSLLEEFELDYILLPDLSENLDGVHKEEYDRLPQGGTDISDIRQMAGAAFTIEISAFLEEDDSPARYLNERYGVPYERVNAPIGLRDTDTFLNLLSRLSGKPIPERILSERGRYLDAMIDNHKYNGEGRAAIYGEPDFIFSTVRLCEENGIMPILCATGSVCKSLQGKIEDSIRKVAQSYFIDSYRILIDTDFKTIEREAVALGVNLLIGNSDGRRMEERLGIHLVRRGFPIHDRVGGQRLRMYGYEGSLTFLDDISNALLARKETGFREELYRRYYLQEEEGKDTVEMESCNKVDKKEVDTIKDSSNSGTEKKCLVPDNSSERYTDVECQVSQREVSQKEGIVIDTTVPTIEEKTKTHPCYNCGASDYARMHLPIAPKCNIQCNYCVRKFDCPNESRPGVTTTVLNPEEAFEKFKEVKEKVPKLSVVGIAGPGDALANFENTKRTLELIREYDPNITFCLSTNGLMLPTYAHELINLGVSHVTVTMNAVDPKIGAKIYKYVRYMGMTYTGEAAAAILLANQLSGLRILTSHGIICKVNIVMLKGINDHHIPEVVKMVKELGGTITNIMQLIPVKGSAFEDMPLVSNMEIMDMRKKCGETMKQMYHCKQCRADAIGTLENDRSIEFNGCGSGCKSEEKEIAALAKEFIDHRRSIKFAIASKGGMLIDQHFGQVSELYIYEYRNGEAIFKEKRNIKKYCEGIEKCEEKEDKMSLIVSSISDCDGVIAMRIGDSPTQKLNSKGIQVYTTYDRIEDAVRNAAKELFQC